MSKYTTEIRFLCESLTGHTESVGFSSVKDVIRDAVPIIFDFDFPLYDPTYKPVLCAKILRHYYTREICEETYGLWKLRLEDRLNTIMPYYNQLYKSALLEFNPFYDVDLTTNHAGSGTDTSSGEITGNTNRQNDSRLNVDETINENGTRIGENNEVITGENEKGIEHTGTIDDTGSKSHNVVNSGSSEDKITEHNEGVVENTQDKTNEYNEDSVGTNNGETASKNDTTTHSESDSNDTKWTLFSDTPQGGINGVDGIPQQGGDELFYLTTATKETDTLHSETDGEEHGTGSQISSDVSTAQGSGTSSENLTGKSEDSNDKTGSKVSVNDNVETDEYSDNNLRTYDEKNEEIGKSSETKNGGFSEVNTNDRGRSNVEVGSNNETVNDIRMDNRISTTTDEYLQRVSGKSGGISYSAMLMEYRETFINIDEMIIEELHDLFFGLW